jgi:hypothetical protein
MTGKRRPKLSLRIKRIVKLAIVPHDKNGYRPHLIRRYWLIAIVFVVMGLQFGYNRAITGNVLGSTPDITINSLLKQTNQSRLDAGVGALKVNEKLNKAAYLKAQDMFNKQYWAHNAPDGTKPWKWLGDVDYDYSEAGENLAKNFVTTKAVVDAWMNSPKHRENMLNRDYQDVGFAVVDGTMSGEATSLIVVFYGLVADRTVISAQPVITNAAKIGQFDMLSQLAVISQSMTPMLAVSLMLLVLASIVSLWAHSYRRKLPKYLRNSWRRHHGLFKAVGLISLSMVIIVLCSSGRI